MTVVCPVCRGMNDGTCRCQPVDFDGRAFDCDMCGSFKVSGTALAMLSDEKDSLTAIQRAALSHHIRSANDAVTELPLITSDWLARFLTAARLPTPGEQAINILRFIGDEVAKTGKPLLIIADEVEGEALATLVVNKIRGSLRVVAVKTPGFGNRRREVLKDVAALTTGRVIAEDVSVNDVTLMDLGCADRVIVSEHYTTVESAPQLRN